MAKSIYRAFITYKKEQEARQSNTSAPSALSEGEKRDEATQPANTPVFKVQILASTRLIPQGSKEFKGVKEIAHYREKGMYKYTCGASTNYNEIVRLKRKLSDRFEGAFIIAFKNGEKMDIDAAICEYNKNNKKQ